MAGPWKKAAATTIAEPNRVSAFGAALRTAPTLQQAPPKQAPLFEEDDDNNDVFAVAAAGAVDGGLAFSRHIASPSIDQPVSQL